MKEKNNIEQVPAVTDKRNPFSVPAGYFESLPARLSERLSAGQAEQISPAVRIWESLRAQLYLAAAILGFALIGYFGFRSFIDTGDQLLSNEEINRYIEFYEDEFSGSYFLSLLEGDEFYFEDAPETDYGLYFEDTEIYIEYLYQDNIDLELIMNDL